MSRELIVHALADEVWAIAKRFEDDQPHALTWEERSTLKTACSEMHAFAGSGPSPISVKRFAALLWWNDGDVGDALADAKAATKCYENSPELAVIERRFDASKMMTRETRDLWIALAGRILR